MKKFVGRALPALAVLLTIGFFGALVSGQGTAFNAGRGAFRGDVYVPSVFNLWFGDNTSTDVALAKNGGSNIGVNGHLGGNTSTANTTATPAGNWAWGTVAFSSSTSATVTFAKAFNANPMCIITEASNTGVTFKCTANTTTLTITASASNSDTVNYVVLGNPN